VQLNPISAFLYIALLRICKTAEKQISAKIQRSQRCCDRCMRFAAALPPQNAYKAPPQAAPHFFEIN